MAVLTAARPVADPSLDGIAAGLAEPAFPSTDDVQSVAAIVRHRLGEHVGSVSADGQHLYELLVSPGTLALRRRFVGGMQARPTWGEQIADVRTFGSRAASTQEVYDVAENLVEDVMAGLKGGRRGVVRGWSRASRKRMHRTLGELDYSTWMAGPGVQALVTVTLPGVWEPLVRDGREWKHKIRRLQWRWRKELDVPWAGLWKFETQKRGAPHQHMLIRVPAMTADGTKTFEDWFADTWSEIVGASELVCHRCHVDHLGYDAALGYGVDHLGYDAWLGYDLEAQVIVKDDGTLGLAWCTCPVPDTERARHRARHGHGTKAVDFAGMAACTDPRRLSVYFGKHGAKTGAKSYQNDPPAAWVAAGVPIGRFWGVWGLQKAVEVVQVGDGTWHQVERVLRGIARGRAAAIALAAARRSGDDRAVWTMRRPRLRSLHGQGGFVLLNDALAVAVQLARGAPV
ncbi:MAG: hypothetical protein BGO38_05325 [Cellulomonas sp. 73-145]|uniref:hypothetical protein n=1 Tax=Cellulomonas sp. 73-145 TaxID=1895739 RepID=UPI00092B843E|nr:hypothetical protein [Cellulomonas sp. 73-145]OJV57556.1 MAG: hypothetical protein BGO38_05325 [Cellulomonas sp. 73-145]